MCVQILCLKNCINVSISPKLNQIVHPIPYISNILFMCNSFDENIFNTSIYVQVCAIHSMKMLSIHN
jgi:hypothetical protein